MTMCFRENTEVTYVVKDNEIIVTYEKAVNNGFNRADIKLDGTVVLQEGFKPSDIDYFIRFTLQNASVLESVVRGEV